MIVKPEVNDVIKIPNTGNLGLKSKTQTSNDMINCNWSKCHLRFSSLFNNSLTLSSIGKPSWYCSFYSNRVTILVWQLRYKGELKPFWPL